MNEKNEKRKIWPQVAVFLAIVVVGLGVLSGGFAGFGSDKSVVQEAASYNGTAKSAFEGASYDSAMSDISMDGTALSTNEMSYDMADGTAVAESADTGSSDSVYEANGMIHYDGYMTIETLDYDQTKSEAETFVQSHGGVIVNFDESDYDYDWYYSEDSATPRQDNRRASYEIRVKSDVFKDGFHELSEALTGKVTSQTTSMRDMTREYNSVNDRKEALEAEKESLMEIMKSANDPSAVITLYGEIANINTELAGLETHANDIEYDADYSTIYLTIQSVAELSPDEEQTFFEKLGDALKDGVTQLKDNIEGIIFFIARNWSSVLILLLFAWICAKLFGWFINGRKRKQKKKAEASKADTESAEPEKKDEEIV